MALPTLLNTRSPLAVAAAQRAVLNALPTGASFASRAAEAGHRPLRPSRTTVLQVNVGKRCNQTCHHCHVDAGPDRTEIMPDDVLDACLTLLERTDVLTLDVTGGAPELHPRFRDLVSGARALGRHVMDRCNLTIVTLPNYASLPEFLAGERVEVVASLPSFAASGTDRQRGDGVFAQSIDALRRFNALGYGREGTGLVLNLVTNPVGAFLPASQTALERDWRRELDRRYGIVFNRLFTMTNMPISRYLEWLERSGNLEGYMAKLVAAFNPANVEGLMCRSTLSIGWDGRLHDCDFNQMLDLRLHPTSPQTVFDLVGRPDGPHVETRDTIARLHARTIVTTPHCFGCTAGGGSSCGGATTP